MRTAESEILYVMNTYHVDRADAIKKLERMVLWATGYKKFIEGQLSRDDLCIEQERIKLWMDPN